MHILFADDQIDTRQLFELTFSVSGHTCHLASDGAQAVQAVEEHAGAFDAIVLDVEMPVMNGWEALERIRSLKHAQETTIIMFSAYSYDRFYILAKKAGADHVVFKPILPQDMLAEIEATFRRKQALRESLQRLWTEEQTEQE